MRRSDLMAVLSMWLVFGYLLVVVSNLDVSFGREFFVIVDDRNRVCLLFCR